METPESPLKIPFKEWQLREGMRLYQCGRQFLSDTELLAHLIVAHLLFYQGRYAIMKKVLIVTVIDDDYLDSNIYQAFIDDDVCLTEAMNWSQSIMMKTFGEVNDH